MPAMSRHANHVNRNLAKRRIPDSVWSAYSEEIEYLYIKRKPPLSLKDIRDHFSETCQFSPSVKQWKDYLNRAGYRRNLYRTAAAIILHLSQEAESQGIQRCIWYNDIVKNRKDIERYILKASTTSEELLESLPVSRAHWPGNIRYADLPVTQVQPSQAAEHSHELPIDIDDQSWPEPTTFDETLYPNDRLLQDDTSTNPLDPVQQSDPVSFSSSMARGSRVGKPDASPSWGLNADVQRDPRTIAAGTSQWPEHVLHGDTILAQLLGDPLDDAGALSGPQNPLDAASFTDYALSDLHGFASVTPLEIDPQRLRELVDQRLGKQEEFRDSPAARKFSRSCIEACVFSGQDSLEGVSNIIAGAVEAFQELMNGEMCLSWSLPLLNRISFLMEAYGQADLKKVIFRELLTELKWTDQSKWLVLRQTLALLLDTANSETWDRDKAAFYVPTAITIYKTATKIAGRNSRLALSARYNLGWVLLEAEKYPEALRAFIESKGQCEHIFGRNSFEAITWTATQARAHFRSEEPETAVALMEENVAVRVTNTFSMNHPFYWSVQYRVGLFLLQIAQKEKWSAETSQSCERATKLLRDTLIWRTNTLGQANPQTIHAYKWLKYYLEQQEKTQQLADLAEWYNFNAESD